MRAGHNQYPPMTGVPALRQAVSDKVALTTGRRYDADTEITITAGATQGILSTVLALVHPGDEVDRAGALLRQLRPVHQAGRRPPDPRASDAGHLAARPRRGRKIADGRARGWSSSTRRTTRAAPCGRRPSSRASRRCWRRRARWCCPTRSTSTWCSTASRTRAYPACPNWPSAASWCRASARPSMSPAGRSAMSPRRQR